MDKERAPGDQATKDQAYTRESDTGMSSGADDKDRARLDKLNRELKAECEKKRRKEKARERHEVIRLWVLEVALACGLIVLMCLVDSTIIDWVQSTQAVERVTHLERPAGVAAAINFNQV